MTVPINKSSIQINWNWNEKTQLSFFATTNVKHKTFTGNTATSGTCSGKLRPHSQTSLCTSRNVFYVGQIGANVTMGSQSLVCISLGVIRDELALIYEKPKKNFSMWINIMTTVTLTWRGKHFSQLFKVTIYSDSRCLTTS